MGLLIPERWDRDPYWCRAWPSALALAQLLCQKPALIQNQSVCEIGAGLGIASMAAALSGESPVNKIFQPQKHSILTCIASQHTKTSSYLRDNCNV